MSARITVGTLVRVRSGWMSKSRRIGTVAAVKSFVSGVNRCVILDAEIDGLRAWPVEALEPVRRTPDGWKKI